MHHSEQRMREFMVRTAVGGHRAEQMSGSAQGCIWARLQTCQIVHQKVSGFSPCAFLNSMDSLKRVSTFGTKCGTSEDVPRYNP